MICEVEQLTADDDLLNAIERGLSGLIIKSNDLPRERISRPVKVRKKGREEGRRGSVIEPNGLRGAPHCPADDTGSNHK